MRLGMILWGFLLLVRLAPGQEILDSLDDHLKFRAFNGVVTGRVSGQMDLEEYYVQQPAPGLIYEDHSFLFNPRFTLNLDVQVGPQVYLFAQGRADRGYDPGEYPNGNVRLDQYAIRYTPWEDGRFNVQIGKFATVVGNWASRHDSWENPFITAPGPYENLTGIWYSSAADSGLTLNSWAKSDKEFKVPIIWGAGYTSGLSLFGSEGKFDYAAEIKNAAISSPPELWSATNVGFSHPTYSGRLGFRPDEAWNLGVSSSVGTYLEPSAGNTLAPNTGFGDYSQITIAQDASYAWHHWQFWAECFETRFQVPTVGNADTLAYYIEAKYRFSPEFSAALRWNQQFFNSIPDGLGGSTSWGSNLNRVDLALTYRFSPHMQAKVQYSFLDQAGPVPLDQNFVAAQFTVRF